MKTWTIVLTLFALAALACGMTPFPVTGPISPAGRTERPVIRVPQTQMASPAYRPAHPATPIRGTV